MEAQSEIKATITIDTSDYKHAIEMALFHLREFKRWMAALRSAEIEAR